MTGWHPCAALTISLLTQRQGQCDAKVLLHAIAAAYPLAAIILHVRHLVTSVQETVPTSCIHLST